MNLSKADRFLMWFLGIVLLLTLMSGCAQDSISPAPTTQPTAETTVGEGHQPNIVIILTDDQRYDTMDFMPETKSLIFDRGITFSRAFATTPLCCPSRASILTGMYDHSIDVWSNTDALKQETFVDRLHAAGYYTGLIGKYLNSWNGTPRPEFDFWVSSRELQYNNPTLNVNGHWQNIGGYETTILGRYTLQFLDQAVKQNKPWLLYYAPFAPHRPAKPERKYKNLYSDLPPFRPPSFDEEDISDKPYASEVPRLTQRDLTVNDRLRLRHLRSLKSVDDTVSDIMRSLDEHGMQDDTAIFYLSDNGILMGEHRISFLKVVPYEPSIRLPFGFYYPRLAAAPRTIDKLVANIDIAPTIYELAGIPQPPEVEGKSLIPLIRGQGPWRDYLVIETWGSPDLSPGDPQPALNADRQFLRPYIAVRTDRYKLVQTIGHSSELYDLEKDPDEMQNEVDNPGYAQVVKDLIAKIDTLREPYMADLDRVLALLTPSPPATSAP